MNRFQHTQGSRKIKIRRKSTYHRNSTEAKIHSFIQQIKKYLLSAQYVPSTSLYGDMVVDKTGQKASLGMKVKYMWGINTMHLVGDIY